MPRKATKRKTPTDHLATIVSLLGRMAMSYETAAANTGRSLALQQEHVARGRELAKRFEGRPTHLPTEERKDGEAYYVVHLSGRVTADHHLYALTPEEAVAKARALSPALSPEHVNDESDDESFAVIGACEGCMVALLEGRDEGQTVDDDGTMLCARCSASDVEPAPAPAAPPGDAAGGGS